MARSASELLGAGRAHNPPALRLRRRDPSANELRHHPQTTCVYPQTSVLGQASVNDLNAILLRPRGKAMRISMVAVYEVNAWKENHGMARILHKPVIWRKRRVSLDSCWRSGLLPQRLTHFYTACAVGPKKLIAGVTIESC